MKLTIEKNTLASALAKIEGIIEKRNTIPQLGHVLLTADQGGLTLKGTDMDVEVTTRAEASVDTSGAMSVEMALLSGIVKKMPAGALITLEEANRDLVVRSGRSRFKLATLPADQFPKMASDDYASTFEVAVSDILTAFNKTSHAISTEETRYYLNGVYFHPNDGQAVVVATDGTRLAKYTFGCADNFPAVIIPRKTVMLARKVFDIGNINMSVSDTKIKFDGGDTVIVSKVIDGQYPDYTRVIPQSLPSFMRVDASEFSQATDRVAFISQEKARGVKIKIGDGKAVMTVHGNGTEGEDVVEAYIEGDEVDIAFNSKFIAEALAQCDGGEVDFRYKGSLDPCLIVPTGDENYLSLVMPFRVN